MLKAQIHLMVRKTDKYEQIEKLFSLYEINFIEQLMKNYKINLCRNIGKIKELFLWKQTGKYETEMGRNWTRTRSEK